MEDKKPNRAFLDQVILQPAGQSTYRSFFIECIRLYRTLPALWDFKSKEYRDKQLKVEAYDMMAEKFREMYPDADREMVKKKINILRTNYRKELKKVLMSGGTYKSNLWYFDEFDFLCDMEEVANAAGLTASSFSSDFHRAKDTETRKSTSNHVQTPASLSKHGTGHSGIYEIAPASSYAKIERDEDSMTCEEEYVHCSGPTTTFQSGEETAALRLSWGEQGSEYQAVGFNVATKLQKMDQQQQIFAELLINKVLARGLLGSLTSATDVSESS